MARKTENKPSRRRPSPGPTGSDNGRRSDSEWSQLRESGRVQHDATGLWGPVEEIRPSPLLDNFECARKEPDALEEELAAKCREWRVTRAEVASLLAATRELFRDVRWSPAHLATDEDGRNVTLSGKGAVALSLKGALGVADQSPHMRVFQCAQHVLTAVLYEPFAPWEMHPLRARRDVVRLLQVAIRKLGGATPQLRGGWTVSHESPTRRTA